MGLTTLEHLCGSHIFSGVEMTTEKHHSLYQGEETDRDVCLFTFDGITYKATEDPDDGYRSYCNDIEMADRAPMYQFPGVQVVCHMMEDSFESKNNVLVVRDALNGKVILEIGTMNTNDYYPYCHFVYSPENMSCNSGA